MKQTIKNLCDQYPSLMNVVFGVLLLVGVFVVLPVSIWALGVLVELLCGLPDGPPTVNYGEYFVVGLGTLIWGGLLVFLFLGTCWEYGADIRGWVKRKLD